MKLDFSSLRDLDLRDHAAEWTDRDAMLYALAVGFGRGVDNSAELPYVSEAAGLRMVPTFATTLPFPDFPRDCGWDYSRVLLAAQRLEIYQPLLPADEVLIDSSVVDVFERGKDRGCMIVTRSEGRRKRDDRVLFAAIATWAARADRARGEPRVARAMPHELPQRPADFVDLASVRPDQARLYRLCGDRNPLHSDPEAARRSGFEAPILHGLCTFGMACRSVLKTVCDYDATLLSEFSARFTAPVYPNDSLKFELWQDGAVVSFRAIAVDRATVVLDNGRCMLKN